MNVKMLSNNRERVRLVWRAAVLYSVMYFTLQYNFGDLNIQIEIQNELNREMFGVSYIT